MYELIFSAAFESQLKKLLRNNPRLKDKTGKIFQTLIREINHPSLKLHKLAGENVQSVSVTYAIRMIIYVEGKRIYCLRIGSHDEVY
jgi:mRNA-degrading endonuclease YafQ of YafQ-DinJ toxin-antitoxin module